MNEDVTSFSGTIFVRKAPNPLYHNYTGVTMFKHSTSIIICSLLYYDLIFVVISTLLILINKKDFDVLSNLNYLFLYSGIDVKEVSQPHPMWSMII